MNKSDINKYRDIFTQEMIDETIDDWSDESNEGRYPYSMLCIYFNRKYNSYISDIFYDLLEDMHLVGIHSTRKSVFLGTSCDRAPRIKALKQIKKLLYPDKS